MRDYKSHFGDTTPRNFSSDSSQRTLMEPPREKARDNTRCSLVNAVAREGSRLRSNLDGRKDPADPANRALISRTNY